MKLPLEQQKQRGRKPLKLPPVGYGAPELTTEKGKADNGQFFVTPDDKLRSNLQGYATNMMVLDLERRNAGTDDAHPQAVRDFVSSALKLYRAHVAAKCRNAPVARIDDPGAIPAPAFSPLEEAWKIIRETLPVGDDRTAFLTAAQEQLGPEPT